MTYYTSLLEDWIEQLYQQIGIYHPEQLDYRSIAKKLNIKLKFTDMSSRLFKGSIIIDSRLTPEEQFEDFAHEACHSLRHAGNHMIINDLFLDLQEFQAKHFIFHFCVPTFMLRNLNFHRSRKETIYLIANTFGVTNSLAERRLELYENKINYQRLLDTNKVRA
ncbi:ImmA/IrrE family metallo-endopeptidase [Priestia aryabhattai]|uniref:ImmA/IrrE family metallo-endopeptidase n=1 Tax=Priestia aryabhattai TaxID=412384 RepID=A0ABD7X2X8_PRIAR|nr:ImmA/IrrE family metallo-endopeptidase [Priestia aryabhattai]WEA46855.1 ImmA/IrrE family metallo-endopeptidase [Priestia aryabhattai]